ncbi:hypothetical protein [Alloactinosynnema sp. L-07]|uniref:hypothetical protein n=1 Tax=Alloactinosynnema sp. L-07 TaxID=1653480 RepID=UPI00065EF71F|nr:hypothetical protein [Alloactinosynnema sp. L-07]CRK61699.1 hypothetical protein [Alloactinosynnema sp. L-07]
MHRTVDKGPDQPDRISRRVFVVGAAGLAAVAAVGPDAGLAAAAASEIDICAGVAVVGVNPQVLCRQGARWVLVGEDGVAMATTGLDFATVLDVATDQRGALAAGSVDGRATLWRSPDGLAWHEVFRVSAHSMFTAVDSSARDALALGSYLSGEDVPTATLSARRRGGTWAVQPVNGLPAYTAITTLSVSRGGWLASAVGSVGSVVHSSANGTDWSELASLDDAALQGVLDNGSEIRWVGNAFGGSAALVGTIGGGRGPADVSEFAHAVGLVRTVRGRVSYWLVDGALKAVTV